MNILNFDNFINEKLNITPVTKQRLAEMKDADVDVAAEHIENAIERYCTFNGMNGGVPNRAGELLMKYGSKCEFAIRDHGYTVDPSDNGVVISWITDEFLEKNAVESLKDMFAELVQKAGINRNVPVTILTSNRFAYDEDGCEPEHVFGYNHITRKFE